MAEKVMKAPPALRNTRKEANDAKDAAQKELIKARLLADKYNVPYTTLDTVEDINQKIAAGKADGSIKDEDQPEERKQTLGRPVASAAPKEPEYEDREITSPDQLHELQESKKLHGFTGWYIEKQEGDETVQLPSKNQKGEYGFVEGAKAIVRVALVLLMAFMVTMGSKAAFAAAGTDGTEESVEGNQRWKITSSGNLEPVADSTYNIGASGNEVSNVYADTVTSTTSAAANYTATGDVKFQTNLFANGRWNAASSAASSSTLLVPANLPFVHLTKYTNGAGSLDLVPGTTLQNGTKGQVLVLEMGYVNTNGGWKVTPTTKTGFVSFTLSAKGAMVNLLYVDDTMGWIIQNYSANVTVVQV